MIRIALHCGTDIYFTRTLYTVILYFKISDMDMSKIKQQIFHNTTTCARIYPMASVLICVAHELPVGKQDMQ